jgi:glycogenin glucosyltransferase
MYLYFSLIALAEAFVSLATNDGYAKGALVLGQSLRENKTSKKLVLMITNDVTQATPPVGLPPSCGVVKTLSILRVSPARALLLM